RRRRGDEIAATWISRPGFASSIARSARPLLCRSCTAFPPYATLHTSPSRRKTALPRRRADRPLPAALCLVCDRPRAPTAPPFQRHSEPDGSVGPPATAGGVPRCACASVPDLRQRRNLLGRSCELDRGIRHPASPHGACEPVAERDGGALRGNGSTRATRSRGRDERPPSQ